MRRFIKLLSPLLLAALFISCAQSVKQNSSISFDGGKIISRAVQYSINKSRSPETKAGDEYFTPEMVEAMKEALEFKATLAMEISSEDGSYNDSVEEDYTVDYPSALAQEKKNITFNNVPVGIKARIDAKITEKLLIKNNDALTEFLGYMKIPFEEFADSSEEELTEFIASILSWDSVFYGKSELTIHEGENPVTLKMTADPNGGGSGEGGEEDIPVDGTIDIEKPVKLTITIDQEKSDSKYYLNKGKIFFILLDEDGNNLLANQENSRVDWTYKLTLRNAEIPKSGASGLRYEANESVGSFEIKNMPAAGNYQLYVQAQKFDGGNYSPSAPTSAVFDLPVENTTYYSFSVNSSDGDNYIDLGPNGGDNSNRVLLASVDSNVDLKLTGEYEGGITSILMNLQDYLYSTFHNKSFTFEIDLSEITGTDTYNSVDSYALRNLDMVTSFKMPETAASYSMAIFQQCTKLEYVRFGEATKDLSKMSIGSGSDCLFQGCSSLKNVEFAKTDGWYSAPEGIRTDLIDWTTLTVPKYNSLNQPVTENGEPVIIQLTAVDVSDPEANATHIKNDDWGYLYRKTE